MPAHISISYSNDYFDVEVDKYDKSTLFSGSAGGGIEGKIKHRKTLEALKKSDRKRPPGPVPDLFTVRGPQPAVRSRRPLLVIAGVTEFAAVAVIGGVVWLGWRSRDPAAPPATPSGEQPSPLSASVPVADVVPRKAVDASSPAVSAPAPARPAVGPAAAKRPSTEVRRPQPAAKPAAQALSGTTVPVAVQPPSGGTAVAPPVPEPLQSAPAVLTEPPGAAVAEWASSASAPGVMLAPAYGPAGALEWLGRDRDLPPVYCGQNNYFLWGPPPDPVEVAVVLGDDERHLGELFEEVELVGIHECEGCMPWRNQMPIWVARRPRVSISKLWPSVKHFE